MWDYSFIIHCPVSHVLRPCSTFWLALVFKTTAVQTFYYNRAFSQWLWGRQGRLSWRGCVLLWLSIKLHRCGSTAGECVPVCAPCYATPNTENCESPQIHKLCRFRWNMTQISTKKSKCSYKKIWETTYNWVKLVQGNSQSLGFLVVKRTGTWCEATQRCENVRKTYGTGGLPLSTGTLSHTNTHFGLFVWSPTIHRTLLLLL